MKKVMYFLALIMLVMPFTSVKAISGNYYVYTIGDEVNFYTSPTDTTGQSSIIISDQGASSQYVKALALAAYSTSTPVYDPVLDASATKFEDRQSFKEVLGKINTTGDGWTYCKEVSTNMSFITLDELKTVFGATSSDNGETYSIDVNKWGEALSVMVSSKTGFYTSTVDGDYIWVVDMTYDNPTDLANRKITAITVKKVLMSNNNDYAYLPVVFFDKTYDCVKRTVQDSYACYQCGNEYSWKKVGTQDSSCTIIEDITSSNNCVKSPNTGIKEYAIELISLAVVCGLALVLINRKDLFKKI